MKKTILFCTLFLANIVYSQNAWEQLNDFSIETRTETSFATSTEAVVLSYDPFSSEIEVFTYDVSSDHWEQKNNFPVQAYDYSSFVLNDQGYVMYMDYSSLEIVLWKYIVATDTWEQKTNAIFTHFGFGNGAQASFAINDKGYVLAPGDPNEQFREYDAVTDSWIIKSNYPSHNQGDQLPFVIGDKAYLAFNYDDISYYDELWEYDQPSDSWLRLADIPWDIGTKAEVSFAIGDNGYIGMNGSVPVGLFYRYKSVSNTWELIENCGYHATLCFGFAIGNYGYVGAGVYQDPTNGNTILTDEVWRLDPDFLGIEDISVGVNINIHPNPTKEALSISGINKEVAYQIYGVSGNLISEGITSNNGLPTVKLSKGVYFLKIISEEKEHYKKFIKN